MGKKTRRIQYLEGRIAHCDAIIEGLRDELEYREHADAFLPGMLAVERLPHFSITDNAYGHEMG